MNKTLHKKLTEKYFYEHTPSLAHADDDALTGFAGELSLLHKDAQNLMQPRPEAIANILRIAKSL